MTLNMASDTVATHLDANSTMTPMTPAIVTTPADQASFASLPREIRDEIYHLALPHSWVIRLTSNRRLTRHRRFTSKRRTRPSSIFRILSPQASTSTYANEACAMLSQRNKFSIHIKDLKVLLGEDGISCVFPEWDRCAHLVPKGCFDVKP